MKSRIGVWNRGVKTRKRVKGRLRKKKRRPGIPLMSRCRRITVPITRNYQTAFKLTGRNRKDVLWPQSLPSLFMRTDQSQTKPEEMRVVTKTKTK